MSIQAFANAIEPYLNYTEMPWGRLFYITAWSQIESHMQDNRQTILDIGCGFGISSLEFARRGNTVHGIDPTAEMIEVARINASGLEVPIEFSVGYFNGAETVGSKGPYSWIFCHNVLEYVEEPRKFIQSISDVQQQGQSLSFIAHNPIAKVMKKAIIDKNPIEALGSIDNHREYSRIIQTEITTYSLEQLRKMLEEAGYEIQGHYGIHNLYGYIADNEVKHQSDWHNHMTQLELQLGQHSPYKDIAIFTHLVAQKRG